MADEQKFALCYLYPRNQDDQFCTDMIPQIHGYYDTWQEASQMRNAKICPEQYWVVPMRNYTGKGY